jgi:Kae1-associated kinase Bud32
MRESNSDSEHISTNHDKWGAEAFLYIENWHGFEVIKKVRLPKSYRIQDIDVELRTSRTITESKLLAAAKNSGVETPTIFEIDLDETSIIMERIDGILTKEWLKSCDDFEKQKNLVKLIGKDVGTLHSNEIIHGDLTTSNIIKKDEKIFFIDFGLGKFSQAIEDKAVDILLMKKCFTSTHTKHEKEFFFAFQEGYLSNMKQAVSVFRRAAKAEARARHLKEDQVISHYLV